MAGRTKLLEPIHPGEILSEEFMKPMGISINQMARDLDVPPNRISQIVHGQRAVTADTALRLATYFKVSPEMWLHLQLGYEMRQVERQRGAEIRKRVRPRTVA
ncbi:MAG: HigA family addiction module antidote protein [Candidatus Solibacter usitatus]|nr:HigA family addiction module antidote protein [Candidatus Solibacter usitatus]